MNLLKQAFDPIDNLFKGRQKTSAQHSGLRGSTPCIPFYQFNGKDVPVYYKTTVAVPIWNTVWGLAQSISGFGSLINVITMIDNLLNAGKREAQYQQYIKDHYTEADKALQWKLDCHLPYCEIVNDLTNIDIKGTFYSPELSDDLKRKFIIYTVAYNNSRLRSAAHIQPILDVAQVTSQNFGGVENYFPPGSIMIRVPHIEYYWLGEKIKVDGISSDCTILMRYGFTEGKKYNAKCSHNMRDGRHICKNLFNGSCGDYCNEGWNLEKLTGEGVLVLDKPYTSMVKKTGTVRLVNTQIIVTEEEKNTPPPPTDTTTTNAEIKEPDFQENSENKAMITTNNIVTVILGVGVIAAFIKAITLTSKEHVVESTLTTADPNKE